MALEGKRIGVAAPSEVRVARFSSRLFLNSESLAAGPIKPWV